MSAVDPGESAADVSPSEREERRRARESWPIRRFALGQEPVDDLRATTNPAERFAMVWQLTLRSWRLGGREIPGYQRSDAPGRVIRSSAGT